MKISFNLFLLSSSLSVGISSATQQQDEKISSESDDPVSVATQRTLLFGQRLRGNDRSDRLFNLKSSSSSSSSDDEEEEELTPRQSAPLPRDDDFDYNEGPLQLAKAIQDAREYMFKEAPWIKDDPNEEVAADRQLKNQLSASLEQGFALHDPYHPELHLFDQQSQFGLFNPDNRYYIAAIEYPNEYIISGTIGSLADVNVQIGGGNPGFDPTEVNIDPIGLLTKAGNQTGIVTDDDGNFEIVISAENTNNAVNWSPNFKICDDNSERCEPGSIVGATGILIRESFMDWESETGCTWYIERLADDTTSLRGLPSPIATRDNINYQYDRASQYLLQGTIGWVDLVTRILNQTSSLDLSVDDRVFLSPPRGDEQFVGQFNSFGTFVLNDDIAYIITVKKAAGAVYQGVQIGDLWFNSLDYCRRQMSLNLDQAVPNNSNDEYKYVVSVQDPGVANWLDPSGITNVVTFLRWQGLDSNDFPRRDFPKIERVAFSELRTQLADYPIFTAEERQAQLAARQEACLTKPRGF